MISVTEWGEYIERLAGASGRIKSCLVVADIAHLKEKLKETDSIEYPLLVGVIPSAYSSTTNDEDNVSELNVCLLFVLSPILRDYDSDTELNNYRDTHEALVDIKRTIRQDYFNCEQYPLLREIKFKSYVQEPEWNMLDLMGWSLGFEVETGEYSSTEPMPPMPPQPPVPPTYSGLRYEYTNEGLVIYQDVKNNYEEDGTFILLIQVGTNDPIMLRAWINTRETYTFATKALNLDNAQTYEVIAFDYTMQETARITLPAYDIFTYGTLTSVYADDADYNDVIRCSLTVTNNTSIAQNCIVYLKHNDHFVQLEEVVTENTAYTFTYDFADVDIFVENIVTFHDSAMNQLSSVTIAATPPFEMYFEATDEMKTITIALQRDLFTSCVLNTGDGRYIDISSTVSLYEISYTENKKYKLTFSNHLNIIYLNIQNQLVISGNAHMQIYIYTGEIKKLKNLQVLTIYGSSAYPFSNVIAEEYELLKLKKLYYILLRCSINIGIGVIRKFAKELTYIRQHSNSGTITFLPDEFSDAFNITYLYLYNAPASRPMLSLQDGVIKNFTKNAYFYLYRVYYNVQPDDSFYNATAIYFNSCNLTSQSVDNAIIICANSGAMNRILNVSGGSTERRTHASDAALALLLSRGWTVTVLEPL
jgi:hypothetical protein